MQKSVETQGCRTHENIICVAPFYETRRPADDFFRYVLWAGENKAKRRLDTPARLGRDWFPHLLAHPHTQHYSCYVDSWTYQCATSIGMQKQSIHVRSTAQRVHQLCAFALYTTAPLSSATCFRRASRLRLQSCFRLHCCAFHACSVWFCLQKPKSSIFHQKQKTLTKHVSSIFTPNAECFTQGYSINDKQRTLQY